MFPSYCRITGHSRNLPKPNYFPILPPISPADAKRFCRITGKAQGGYDKILYIPVLDQLVTSSSPLVKCVITGHFSKSLFAQSGTDALVNSIKQVQVTKRSQSSLNASANSGAGESPSTPTTQYAYLLEKKKVLLLLPEGLEASITDGLLEDMHLVEGSRLKVTMKDGVKIFHELTNVNLEDINEEYVNIGSGLDDKTLKSYKKRKSRAKSSRHRHRKGLLSLRKNIFEEKERKAEIAVQKSVEKIQPDLSKVEEVQKKIQQQVETLKKEEEEAEAVRQKRHASSKLGLSLNKLDTTNVQNVESNVYGYIITDENDTTEFIKAVEFNEKDFRKVRKLKRVVSGQFDPDLKFTPGQMSNSSTFIPGQVLTVENQELFIPGKINEENRFIPGQVLVTAETKEEIFIPGQTVQLSEGDSKFVPGEVMETDSGEIRFVPGEIIEDEEDGIHFMPGEVVETTEGLRFLGMDLTIHTEHVEFSLQTFDIDNERGVIVESEVDPSHERIKLLKKGRSFDQDDSKDNSTTVDMSTTVASVDDNSTTLSGGKKRKSVSCVDDTNAELEQKTKMIATMKKGDSEETLWKEDSVDIMEEDYLLPMEHPTGMNENYPIICDNTEDAANIQTGFTTLGGTKDNETKLLIDTMSPIDKLLFPDVKTNTEDSKNQSTVTQLDSSVGKSTTQTLELQPGHQNSITESNALSHAAVKTDICSVASSSAKEAAKGNECTDGSKPDVSRIEKEPAGFLSIGTTDTSILGSNGSPAVTKDNELVVKEGMSYLPGDVLSSTEASNQATEAGTVGKTNSVSITTTSMGDASLMDVANIMKGQQKVDSKLKLRNGSNKSDDQSERTADKENMSIEEIKMAREESCTTTATTEDVILTGGRRNSQKSGKRSSEARKGSAELISEHGSVQTIASKTKDSKVSHMMKESVGQVQMETNVDEIRRDRKESFEHIVEESLGTQAPSSQGSISVRKMSQVGKQGLEEQQSLQESRASISLQSQDENAMQRKESISMGNQSNVPEHGGFLKKQSRMQINEEKSELYESVEEQDNVTESEIISTSRQKRNKTYEISLDLAGKDTKQPGARTESALFDDHDSEGCRAHLGTEMMSASEREMNSQHPEHNIQQDERPINPSSSIHGGHKNIRAVKRASAGQLGADREKMAKARFRHSKSDGNVKLANFKEAMEEPVPKKSHLSITSNGGGSANGNTKQEELLLKKSLMNIPQENKEELRQQMLDILVSKDPNSKKELLEPILNDQVMEQVISKLHEEGSVENIFKEVLKEQSNSRIHEMVAEDKSDELKLLLEEAVNLASILGKPDIARELAEYLESDEKVGVLLEDEEIMEILRQLLFMREMAQACGYEVIDDIRVSFKKGEPTEGPNCSDDLLMLIKESNSLLFSPEVIDEEEEDFDRLSGHEIDEKVCPSLISSSGVPKELFSRDIMNYTSESV